MRQNRHFTVLTILIACAGAAAAWQTALSAVGWSEQKAAQVAESLFTSSSMMLPDNGSMPPAVKARWIGKTPAERAQAIRELALYAKKYVQAPAFEKLYTGWMKEHYDAVNHGIKPSAPAEGDVNAAMSIAAKEMAKAFDQLDGNMLRMLLTNDIDSLKNSSDARDKKLLARYREVEALTKSNLPEARKRYAMAKTMQMGGAEDEAGFQANVAAGEKAAAEMKRQQQQRAWDEHNLKAELRRRLTEFVKTAESVDFSAQTQRNAGKMVFSNPAYERKPHQWKILYRLGKEPTMAAVDVAKQWLREL
jgi:hypothetical protein